MNVVREKSFDFAVKIVNLYRFLCAEKKDNIFNDCNEIIKLLVTIVKTTKKNLGDKNEK